MALPFIMRNQYLACFKFCATSELNVVQVIYCNSPIVKLWYSHERVPTSSYLWSNILFRVKVYSNEPWSKHCMTRGVLRSTVSSMQFVYLREKNKHFIGVITRLL